ncbi:tol-pal system-associated acyl-CoA thioesterase [Pseudomaricurvus alkylphenolicus]|jgi:4-hydroxybenzoyl-CoA thioesterase/acyl-CoA thioester hydrolase|uniref:tol-pal system-associated acyl-CoA thioesterase n=1 Tax=Pseudomaricurvus alkylphenolicus TaxID=1306991 RepID=UPI0014225CF5|nr:tol-pal system-associated acyl-CoA thioesterase [Pseudomaricurvus alkylphenolicus]NIB42000.1 tol-pal system-associated acyl-CoA thioesterase [Pseudomaricurvus alkylphenolicus]
MSDHHFPLRVYIEDTDAGGIVYYVNYLKFMERGRTELMRSLGFGKAAILEEGRMFVVHGADVRYLRPAQLDDELTVVTSISKLARSYLIFRQQVVRSGEPLCQGEIKVACVEQASMKPVAIPGTVHSVLKQQFSLRK